MAFDFSGVENAQIFERGNFLPPGGKYRLRVMRTIVKKTRKSGDAFIAEFEVIESDLDEVKVGSRYSWFQKLVDTDVAFPAIKEFIATLLGFDVRDKEGMKEFNGKVKSVLQEASEEYSKEEDHPLHGLEILCETYQKETKQGKDFTVHSWSVAEE